jgi:hypothetical protein
MNPIYLIIYILSTTLIIMGLIKIFTGSILLGLGFLLGAFILGSIGGVMMNGGKWK